MNGNLLRAALIVSTISCSLYAQNPLAFDEVAALTLQHNPELKKAEEAVNKATANYKGSFSNFLPQISANAGTSKSHSTKASGSTSSERTSIGISGKQSLFSGFRDKAEIAQQKATLSIALADLVAVKAQVSFELNQAFSKLLFSQENSALSKRIADRQRENVRLISLRYEGGRENKGAFLRVKAAYHQAQFNRAESERDLKLAKRDLTRVVGTDPLGDNVASGVLGSTAPLSTPNFPVLIKETPLYVQTEMRLKASEAGITIAQSQFFPELSANGAISRQGNNFPLDTESWSAGVSASYSLFTGGRNANNLKSAKSDFAQQKAAFETVQNQLAFDLEESFFRYQSTTEKISVQQEFLEAAKIRASIAKSQYTNGLLSFEDWDIIENDLIQQEKLMLSTLRDASIAEANWNRIQGKGVFR